MQLEKVVMNTYFMVLIILSPWKFFVAIFLPHIFAKFSIISLNMLQHDGMSYRTLLNCDRENLWSNAKFKPMHEWLKRFHVGCDENSLYNHSRNFTGTFLNYMAYNNGYHTVLSAIQQSRLSMCSRLGCVLGSSKFMHQPTYIFYLTGSPHASRLALESQQSDAWQTC